MTTSIRKTQLNHYFEKARKGQKCDKKRENINRKRETQRDREREKERARNVIIARMTTLMFSYMLA